MAVYEVPPGMVVTGASANHIKVAHGLIHSAQDNVPSDWQIIIYDLTGDIKEHKVIRTWCRVEYRRFNATAHGLDLDRRVLTNSAWKPLIILECLQQLPRGGMLVYADASIRFGDTFPQPALVEALSRYGFISRPTNGPVALYTHPNTARKLHEITGGRVHPELVEYTSAPMACGCFSVWRADSWTIEELATPWAVCARTAQCILPRGSKGFNNRAGFSQTCKPGFEGACHRGDQSALSLILFEAFAVRRSYGNSTQLLPTKASHVHQTSPPFGASDVPYLRNTTVSKETWKFGQTIIYGSRVTIERFDSHSPVPLHSTDSRCRVQGQKKPTKKPTPSPSNDSKKPTPSPSNDCYQEETITRQGVQPNVIGNGYLRCQDLFTNTSTSQTSRQLVEAASMSVTPTLTRVTVATPLHPVYRGPSFGVTPG